MLSLRMTVPLQPGFHSPVLNWLITQSHSHAAKLFRLWTNNNVCDVTSLSSDVTVGTSSTQARHFPFVKGETATCWENVYIKRLARTMKNEARYHYDLPIEAHHKGHLSILSYYSVVAFFTQYFRVFGKSELLEFYTLHSKKNFCTLIKQRFATAAVFKRLKKFLESRRDTGQCLFWE